MTNRGSQDQGIRSCQGLGHEPANTQPSRLLGVAARGVGRGQCRAITAMTSRRPYCSYSFLLRVILINHYTEKEVSDKHTWSCPQSHLKTLQSLSLFLDKEHNSKSGLQLPLSPSRRLPCQPHLNRLPLQALCQELCARNSGLLSVPRLHGVLLRFFKNQLPCLLHLSCQ